MNKIIFLLFGIAAALKVGAQDPQQAAENYFAEHAGEKLYVHLARPYALAGEELHFRLFHVTSRGLRPEPLSKVAYVELFDAENNPVSKVRVRMDDAGGWGFLELPADINSGRYILRAYTQWMRNGPESLFFHAPLQVINTFKRLGLGNSESNLSIKLFPEGGNFVYGLSSHAGLMIRSESGKPESSVFSLLSGDSIVVTGKTDQMGLADVTITPVQNERLFIALGNDTIPIETGALTEGITMSYGDGEVRFVTNGNMEGQSSTLVILARDAVNYYQQKVWNNGKLSFGIPSGAFHPGVNQITLLDSQGRPRSERLVFIRPEEELEIDLQNINEVYTSRDPFEMEINVKDAGAPSVTDLSVSVYYWDPLLGDPNIDISAYFHLVSELEGLTSLPEGYLDDEDHIERLLLTYGWRRYDWAKILREPEVEYLPEFRQPVTRGEVSEPGISLFASMPESSEKLFIAQADAAGKFSFELPNAGDQTRMIIQAQRDLDLTIEDPFDPRKPDSEPGEFEVSEELAETFRKANVNLQVRKHFVDPPAGDEANGNPFYGQADVSYLLDDYTRFPVMEEVFREYVYGVYVRKRAGEFNLFVLDEGSGNRMTEEPLILLDGVPIFDTDKLMALDPLTIRKIEVVRRKYGYGPSKANGIVALYSYKSDLAGYSLPENAIDGMYRAAQRYKEYYIPEHIPGEQDRLPDFRNQVFWQPRVITDESGKARLNFSLPDNKGLFRIVIQGITADGTFGSATGTFRIK